MSRNTGIELHGTISERLANGMYRAQLENGHTVIVSISGKMRANMVRIAPGDRVLVEVSPYDLSKGTVIYCYK